MKGQLIKAPLVCCDEIAALLGWINIVRTIGIEFTRTHRNTVIVMGGDFTGCTSLRKKSCSGGSANSKTSSNGGGGGGGNNSNSSSSSRNHEGAGKGRRIFDNNNGGGGGIGESGVLVPVHHHYKDPLKTYKIVILGDGGVGKSGNLYIYIYVYLCLFWDRHCYTYKYNPSAIVVLDK